MLGSRCFEIASMASAFLALMPNLPPCAPVDSIMRFIPATISAG